jgi:hypothetical protein
MQTRLIASIGTRLAATSALEFPFFARFTARFTSSPALFEYLAIAAPVRESETLA